MTDGVRRGPVDAPAPGAAEILGRRVCRGREANVPALGVAAGSRDAIESFLVGIGGLNGMGRIARGASDNGGEGGVEFGRRPSGCMLYGGVEAAVGEDIFVLVVEASEKGERGRNVCDSFARWLETAR